MKRRCQWAESHPLLAAYHDEEWGVPVHDDRHWYEKLTLDGAQAGLSWLTILKRREGYRAAFCDFEVERVAKLGARDVERLMQDTGIIRNRLKILSAIENARAFMRVQEEFGSFDAFIWAEVGGRPCAAACGEVSRRGAHCRVGRALEEAQEARLHVRGSTIVYRSCRPRAGERSPPDCWRAPVIDRMAKAPADTRPVTAKKAPTKEPLAKKAPVAKAPAKKAPVAKAPAAKKAPAKKGVRRG